MPFEVRASVYDLVDTNKYIEMIGSGVYHVGIEVCGLEWSFGACNDGTGIFFVSPRESTIGKFKESVPLGVTNLNPSQILDILITMSADWKGADYHVLSKNCLKFSQAFVDRIAPGLNLPEYAVATAGSLEFLKEYIVTSSASVVSTNVTSANTEMMWQMAATRMQHFNPKPKLRTATYPKSIPAIIHNNNQTQKKKITQRKEIDDLKTYTESLTGKYKYSSYAQSILR